MRTIDPITVRVFVLDYSIEGDIGIFGFSVFRFWLFFRSVFPFLCQKTSVFRFWCSLRFVDFSLFRIRFSVFVENNSGFSVLLSKVVCIQFSVLAEFFWRCCGFG